MPAMDMDMDSDFPMLAAQRSLPVRIASPRPPMREMDDEHLPIPKLDHEALQKAAKKRRKRNRKAVNGMGPGAPATNVIRGFHTPVTSGGEESDISATPTPYMGATIMRDVGSLTNSPAMRAATPSGGISALKARLDALALDGDRRENTLSRVMSSHSVGCDSVASPSSRGSDGDKTEMDSYEVRLDEDFASLEAGSRTPIYASHAVEGGVRNASIQRKMCADDFEPLRCLGKGAFGTVHLVRQHGTGRLYAQKQFKKASLTVHKRLVEQTKTERVILESVNRHPFVVKLYYAFQDHERLYLILEYAQGGELFHHLKLERMFSEETAAFYMAEMVLALQHLHHNVKVIYRDLKPENCLLDSEGHLLLTDFGLSKVALEDDSRTNSILGTIEYMAPEVVQGLLYDFTVDWWSLGAIGFDFLTGSPPFTGNNHAKIQQNIVKQKLALPYFLSPDAKDILTRLLRKEPSKRLGGTTQKELKALKAHRFFRQIDWTALERRDCEPPIQPVITDPELAENFDTDFTDLPLSPVMLRGSRDVRVMEEYAKMESNPFQDFSYTASRSVLDDDAYMLPA